MRDTDYLGKWILVTSSDKKTAVRDFLTKKLPQLYQVGRGQTRLITAGEKGIFRTDAEKNTVGTYAEVLSRKFSRQSPTSHEANHTADTLHRQKKRGKHDDYHAKRDVSKMSNEGTNTGIKNTHDRNTIQKYTEVNDLIERIEQLEKKQDKELTESRRLLTEYTQSTIDNQQDTQERQTAELQKMEVRLVQQIQTAQADTNNKIQAAEDCLNKEVNNKMDTKMKLFTTRVATEVAQKLLEVMTHHMRQTHHTKTLTGRNVTQQITQEPHTTNPETPESVTKHAECTSSSNPDASYYMMQALNEIHEESMDDKSNRSTHDNSLERRDGEG